MELFQLFWDDQRNLILEFREDQEASLVQCPQAIKSLNLKYEISKIDPNQRYPTTLPSLVSIKEFKDLQDRLLFKIDLQEILETNELQINFKQLTVILHGGRKKKVEIKKTINLDEIIIDDEYYEAFLNPELIQVENKIIPSKSINSSLCQERVYRKIKADPQTNKPKDLFIYQKNSVSFSAESNEFVSAIKENSQRLEAVEKELQNLSKILKDLNMSPQLRSLTPPNPPPKLNAPVVKAPPIKRLPLRKPAISSKKLPFLGELSSIFEKSVSRNEEFNFREILKPMNEEELEKVTLNEEELKKREEAFYTRQIERFAEETAQ